MRSPPRFFNDSPPLKEGIDYYVEPDGNWVFTEFYLLNRGYCCHQGCRHCPYENEGESQ